MPDAWGRRVIENILNAPLNGLSESEYLLHSGHDRAGALDFRPAIAPLELTEPADLGSLPGLAEAAALIERGQRVPSDLRSIFDCGASLGGARPKAAVRDRDGVEWVAKFPSVDDRLSVPLSNGQPSGSLRGRDSAPLWSCFSKSATETGRYGMCLTGTT